MAPERARLREGLLADVAPIWVLICVFTYVDDQIGTLSRLVRAAFNKAAVHVIVLLPARHARV